MSAEVGCCSFVVRRGVGEEQVRHYMLLTHEALHTELPPSHMLKCFSCRVPIHGCLPAAGHTRQPISGRCWLHLLMV